MFRRYPMLFAMAMLLIAGVWGAALAQTEEELIALRNAGDVALNAHDLDLVMTYWADDAVWDVVATPPPAGGREAVRAAFEALLQGLPDLYTTEGRILASGNILVVEHSAGGTHQGEWMGIPATGQSVVIPHIDIFEFEGDKIKKVTTYTDNVSIMVQLGLMPASDLPPLEPSFELPEPEATGLAPLEAEAEIESRFSSHDLSEVAKMVRQDAEMRFNTLGMIPMNRDQYVAAVEMILLSNSTIRADIVRGVDLGDGWVVSELVVSGTNDGPYFGIPPSGKPTEVRAAKLAHYDVDGLLTNLSLYFDNLTVLMQMGAVPPPEPTTVTPSSWGRIKSMFRE